MERRRLKALLISDDTASIRRLQAKLEETQSRAPDGLEIETETVKSLSSALSRLALDGVGVVVMDLVSSGCKGLAGVSKLRAAAPDVPLVVLGGHHSEAFASAVLKRGAQDCLQEAGLTSEAIARAITYAVERQRRQTGQLRAFGKLAGQVAHDFNNILTVIAARAEFLTFGFGVDDPRLLHYEAVRLASARAAQLTRQLSDLSQASSQQSASTRSDNDLPAAGNDTSPPPQTEPKQPVSSSLKSNATAGPAR